MGLVGFGLLIQLARENRAASHDEGFYAIGDYELDNEHASDLCSSPMLSEKPTSGFLHVVLAGDHPRTGQLSTRLWLALPCCFWNPEEVAAQGSQEK